MVGTLLEALVRAYCTGRFCHDKLFPLVGFHHVEKASHEIMRIPAELGAIDQEHAIRRRLEPDRDAHSGNRVLRDAEWINLE